MDLTCQMILWELTVIHKDATAMTEPRGKKTVEPSSQEHMINQRLLNSRLQKNNLTQHQAVESVEKGHLQ